MQTKIEINPATNKWRFYDCELKVYSSEEWPKKIHAVKQASKYRRRHNLKNTKGHK
jgi:hypothetical protein